MIFFNHHSFGLLFIEHGNFTHHIVCIDGVNHIHPLYYLSKYGVHAIQVGLGAVGDEELAATGVFTCVGHGQSSSAVFMWIYFTFDSITWPSSSITLRTSSLDYEIRYYPVKG